MCKAYSLRSLLIFIAVISVCVVSVIDSKAQQNGNADKQITIPVTVYTNSERTRSIANNLQPTDFIVQEDKQQQQILSIKRPSETPIILSILIQDDLTMQVGNEIKGLQKFIQNLPLGSQVMTGYITAGTLQVTQDFTADRLQAADSLRIPISSNSASSYSPYLQVRDAVRLFENMPEGRRIILLVSDGLELSQGFRGGSVTFSLHLENAIKAAQRLGIAIYSFYAPSAGLMARRRLASFYGQGALNRLANETGGVAFQSGVEFVMFDAYFKKLNEMIANQWLITYSSTNRKTSFRRIKVSTDFDIDLNYPIGYYPK